MKAPASRSSSRRAPAAFLSEKIRGSGDGSSTDEGEARPGYLRKPSTFHDAGLGRGAMLEGKNADPSQAGLRQRVRRRGWTTITATTISQPSSKKFPKKTRC